MNTSSALSPSQCSENTYYHSIMQSTIVGGTRESPRSHLSPDIMVFEIPITVISKMHIVLSTQHGSMYNSNYL